MPRALPRSLVVAASLGAWILSVGVGSSFLWDYQTRAGARAEVPRGWPVASSLARSVDRPTLVMLAHPRCPCTRASIEELAKLMAWCADLVDASVLFYAPAEGETGFEQTDLWASAERIPGVRVVCDRGGREAELFGAETSGHVLLYGSSGELLFSGGITASRGHAGDNAGRATIAALVGGEAAENAEGPVFGCSLSTPDTCCDESRSLP